MGIKSFKPRSPARRFFTVSSFEELTVGNEPERSLVEHQTSTGGRNHYGRVTSRFRGGGHKQRYRVIDWKRNKIGVPGKIATIEYDPNRTARIALVNYADGEKRYILAPDGLKAGDTVLSSRHADIKPGNALPLRFIPLGTTIHNVELKIGRGAQAVRSAGAAAQLVAKEGDWGQVRMPSGEIRQIHLDCRCTVGQVSNTEHANISISKGGSIALARQATAQPRRIDEPGRSPHGRRRRTTVGRAASVLAVGPAQQGSQDKTQQANRRHDH